MTPHWCADGDIPSRTKSHCPRTSFLSKPPSGAPQNLLRKETCDAAAQSSAIESADPLPPCPVFFRRRKTRSGFAMLPHFLSPEEEEEAVGQLVPYLANCLEWRRRPG
ncbi:hypothetical protein MTO96_051261 [Rhipicephalus appendiculatus]